MRASEGFRIVIGDAWRSTTATALGQGPHPHGIVDLARVRDFVDIIVDGTSLVGDKSEDSIFFLVRDLLHAVEQLASREGAVRVSFYEGPYEIVIQRLGDAAYVTCYVGGAVPEILVKDHEIRFADLASGVVASSIELEERTLALDPALGEDPLIGSLAAARERLARILARGLKIGTRPRVEPELVESSRFARPRTETGFSFGYRFVATATDLLQPGKQPGSDLNALLFRGRLVIHARHRRLLLGDGFLLLEVERMLFALGQLLAAWEENRPLALRVVSGNLALGLKLARGDDFTVTFTDLENAGAPLALADLSPWELADAILGLARELKRHIVGLSKAQRRNLRLEALDRQIKDLANRSRELRRGGVINREPERYRRLAEPWRQRPTSRVQLGESQRLLYRQSWRAECEALDLDGTMLLGEVAIVSTRETLLGLDTANGQAIWRRDLDRADHRVQLAGQDGLVRVTPGGTVELVDLMTGASRWRTQLAPRSGGSPVALVVDHGPAPGVVLAAEEDRKLVALDLRTGEPRWRFVAAHAGRFALRRHGRLLYVTSGDNQLHAIDLENGELVWRFTDRTSFFVPAATDGDILVACGGRAGRADGRMYGLDAFSGEPRWQTALGGGAATAPIVADHAALVPLGVDRRHELAALDTASGDILWRLGCDGWADSCALMALDDAFIVNAAGGVVRSVGARDGEERWVTELGPATSDDVPISLRVVLRGGALFVPADTVYVVRPDDGAIIHSLGADSPVPDLLQVDLDGSVFVAEESGHVALFQLGSRLSVVR